MCPDSVWPVSLICLRYISLFFYSITHVYSFVLYIFKYDMYTIYIFSRILFYPPIPDYRSVKKKISIRYKLWITYIINKGMLKSFRQIRFFIFAKALSRTRNQTLQWKLKIRSNYVKFCFILTRFSEYSCIPFKRFFREAYVTGKFSKLYYVTRIHKMIPFFKPIFV